MVVVVSRRGGEQVLVVALPRRRGGEQTFAPRAAGWREAARMPEAEATRATQAQKALLHCGPFTFLASKWPKASGTPRACNWVVTLHDQGL